MSLLVPALIILLALAIADGLDAAPARSDDEERPS